jgi:16S rRNA (cytidine1402-2'-O)-methyltransferase
MEGSVLYVVATPIGNLDDITPRALQVLSQVDLVAAEDTRHSSRLLNHFGIKTRLLAMYDHNERQRSEFLLRQLHDGLSVALVSDAGTPLISDPGFFLVRKVRAAGYTVVPVVGACALVAALSVAGLPTDRFAFNGFIAARPKARKQQLQNLCSQSVTQVFYESKHRIVSCMEDLVTVCGPYRQVVIARELTKVFETVYGDVAEKVLHWLRQDSNHQRGEFVVLVAGSDSQLPALDFADSHLLVCLLETMPVKQAVVMAARITGGKKNKLYELALAIKAGHN